MKLKIFICLLTCVTALYLFNMLLHEAEPPKVEKTQAHDARKIPTVKDRKVTRVKKESSAPGIPQRQALLVKNALPPKLAAAIVASEPKSDLQKQKVRQALSSRKSPPKKTKQKHRRTKIKKTQKNVRSALNHQTLLAQKTITISHSQSVIGARMRREGIQLPLIEASWNEIGFDNYLKMMRKVGGHLYVGDTESKQILAKVELHYYQSNFRFLRFRDPGSMKGLALFRPREIVDEPLVNEIISAASDQWPGSQRFAIVVLLPATIETGFLGSLNQYLESYSYPIESLRLVRGEYFVAGNEFGLMVKAAVKRHTGQRVNLRLKISI